MANSRTAGGGRWVRLRRLVQRIGEYNWLVAGVYLVIVVLGVFIGLQANNWNQTREDRARAQAYLTRLHNDLTRAGDAQGAAAELSCWSTQLRIQLNVIRAERQAASDVLKLVDRARK